MERKKPSKMVEMISIEKALHILKANIFKPAEKEYVLEDSIGKHLIEDIYALESSPRFTNSAKDGYGIQI